MNAIRTGGLLTTVAPPEITTGKAWFKPVAEMQKLFPDHPELLRATLEIAERSNLQLELGKLIFPEFTVSEGHTPDSYLQKLSLTGALKRYHSFTPEVRSRLMRELEVIKKWGLAPYFLLVLEIVEEARRRGIPAVARGSAASSMVTYCLGISRVCPLRWGLYFERFLNDQRGDCPDIDIDICGARRDELLDYVYQRWGAEHVAMIASFITMHARLAVREVAKVFGVSPGEVDRFTKRLPHRPVRDILSAIRDLPECRDLPVHDEPWKTVLQVALRLDNLPRHLGIHPCGTVISARPLTWLTPLERATKGIVVTQYDMNAIEALGLIKMDLLGQRGFTTLSLALDNVEKAKNGSTDNTTIAPDGTTPCPKPREIDFDALPENDPATCDVIAAGRTIGIFQIESPAMRGLLRTMKARTLEQVAQALALVRPGAAEYGSKELFVKRLRKQENVTFAHPRLEPILGTTLGVCIFQEQVMQISQAIGNMSLAEADLVRRGSTKVSGRSDRQRLLAKFMKAARNDGIDESPTKRNLDDGRKIRRLRLLQSARRDVCGHLLPHGVSEDASSSGVPGSDVQRGSGVLSRVGVCGRSQALGHRGAAAVGESFADGIYGRGRRKRSTRASYWTDAGEGPARRNDHGYSAHAGRSWRVPLSGGFFAPCDSRTR